MPSSNYGPSRPNVGLLPHQAALIRLPFALIDTPKWGRSEDFSCHTGNTVERLKAVSCYQYAD